MSRIAPLVLAGVLALAACGEDPEPAAGPAALRVGVAPTGSMLPFHVADTNGIFAKHGLRVTRTEVQDLPALAAAVDNGQQDIVNSVPTVVLVGAERGLDLQVVSRMQRSSAEEPNAVWVTRDPSITSIGQLKGKAVAVPALTGILTDSLVYLLRQHGLGRSDIKLVAMPFAVMGDQLAAGRVDAAVSAIPFSTALAARGFVAHDDVVVAAVTHASGGAVTTGMTSVFASTSAFARKHPDVIRAFRAALTEAVEYLRTHGADARELLVSWLKMPPQVARTAPLPSWEVPVTAADLRPYVTIARTVGTIKGDPDVEALVWRP